VRDVTITIRLRRYSIIVHSTQRGEIISSSSSLGVDQLHTRRPTIGHYLTLHSSAVYSEESMLSRAIIISTSSAYVNPNNCSNPQRRYANVSAHLPTAHFVRSTQFSVIFLVSISFQLASVKQIELTTAVLV